MKTMRLVLFGIFCAFGSLQAAVTAKSPDPAVSDLLKRDGHITAYASRREGRDIVLKRIG
jgi:hypothetical protein